MNQRVGGLCTDLMCSCLGIGALLKVTMSSVDVPMEHDGAGTESTYHASKPRRHFPIPMRLEKFVPSGYRGLTGTQDERCKQSCAIRPGLEGAMLATIAIFFAKL
jgi:hypothetical protein